MGRCLVQGVERRLLNVDFFFAVRFLACRDLFGGQEAKNGGERRVASRAQPWRADVIAAYYNNLNVLTVNNISTYIAPFLENKYGFH